MNKRRHATRRGDRRGVAAVEFALIAPLFFMVVLGCVEFGRGLMVQQVLTNASRVGAREATVPNTTVSAVVSTVENYASGASVPTVVVNVTPNPATARAGDLMSVTVTANFGDVSWTPAPWFLGGTNLSATSVMRREGFE